MAFPPHGPAETDAQDSALESEVEVESQRQSESRATLSEVQRTLAENLPSVVIAGIVLGVTTLFPGIPIPVAGVIGIFLLICLVIGLAFRTKDGRVIGPWAILTNGLWLTIQFVAFLVVLFLGLTIIGGLLGILGR